MSDPSAIGGPWLAWNEEQDERPHPRLALDLKEAPHALRPLAHALQTKPSCFGAFHKADAIVPHRQAQLVPLDAEAHLHHPRPPVPDRVQQRLLANP
jgi:hypothetical protein